MEPESGQGRTALVARPTAAPHRFRRFLLDRGPGMGRMWLDRLVAEASETMHHMLKTRRGLTLSLLSAAVAAACAGGVYAAAGGVNKNTATTIYDPITLQPISLTSTTSTGGATDPNSIGGGTG